MTSLIESILSSTNSGKTEQVIKELSELLKIRFEKDFWYDEKKNDIYFFSMYLDFWNNLYSYHTNAIWI